METMNNMIPRILAAAILSIAVAMQIAACGSTKGREKALRIAANNGETEKVKRLLWLRADVNAANEQGHTALMAAARYSHSDVVEILVEHGADIHAKTASGSTALIEVVVWNWGSGGSVEVLRRRKKIVNLLVDNGADVSEAVRGCWGGDTEIMRILLEAGADPNVRASREWTPLMRVSMGGYVESAKLLIEYGADLDAKQDMGESALSLAVEHCEPEVVALLLESGAKIDFDVNEFLRNPPSGFFEQKKFSEVIRALRKAGVEIDYGQIPMWDDSYVGPLLDSEETRRREQAQPFLQFPIE